MTMRGLLLSALGQVLPGARDPLALAAACVAGLFLAALAEDDLSLLSDRRMLGAQAAFWLAAVTFVRWLSPQGGVSLARALSGLALATTAGIAMVHIGLAALGRGFPSPLALASLALDVRSVVFTLLLAPAFLLLARRAWRAPEPAPPSEDAGARRHEEALSIVFHELRRPLSALVSASEMALDTGIPADERERLVRSVHRQALKLNDYLEEILEAARIQSGRLRLNLKPLDLRQFVKEECAELAQAHPERELKVVASRSLPPVAGDPAKLRMVLNNLVSNAFSYSPEGEPVTVRLAGENGRVRLQVEDKGPGVPEPYRRQIFEQFFRIPGVSGRGFGLGLYIARQLVRAHSGSIGVEARKPRGSRFVVELPALRRAVVLMTPEVSGPIWSRRRPRRRVRTGRTSR